MQYAKRSKSFSWRAMLLVCVAVIASAAVFRISSTARAGVEPPQQQDVIRLESRLTQLEQRMYSIDTNIRTLEQQSRMAAGGRGIGQDDLAQLRSEVQLLQRRLADAECGLAKLDERTLAPATRAARRKSSGGDPCRLSSELPLR